MALSKDRLQELVKTYLREHKIVHAFLTAEETVWELPEHGLTQFADWLHDQIK